MSEKYKVIDSTEPTFITVVDWVDLFIRPVYCNILDESPTGARLQRVPTYLIKKVVAFATRLTKTEVNSSK